MKKLILLLLAFGLTACSDNSDKSPHPPLTRGSNTNVSSEESLPVKGDLEGLSNKNISGEMKTKRPLYGISPVIPVFNAISPALFEELYNTGKTTVIDIRTPQEIAEGKIFDDALEINFYDTDFREKISKLDKNKPYLIHCRSGGRSGKALQIFDELGFREVYDLAGGKIRWDKYKAKEKNNLEKNAL